MANVRPSVPCVIGHRGAAGSAPENTLASLRQAHAEGAGMVEIDVRLSADGVPVLLHDATLDRTTSATGSAMRWTAQAMGRLDAGSWKHPRFRGEAVPTLCDVITLCTDLGLGLNIEIKPNHGQASETAMAIADVLRTRWPDTLALPLVSSFELASLVTLRDAAPELRRGLLFEHRPSNWKEIATLAGAWSVHLWERAETPESVAALAGDGFLILIYTVNDPAAARRWLEAGASAVITDCPGRILRSLCDGAPADMR
jgi:glycerophosphoryl diester phosphodiesterase